MQLIDALDKYGENWDEIIKAMGDRRTKPECILHLMQLPIRDNIVFKLTDFKQISNNNSNVNESQKLLSNVKDTNAIFDQNNPIIAQIVFFAKMFEKFVNIDSKKSPDELKAQFNLNNIDQSKSNGNGIYILRNHF